VAESIARRAHAVLKQLIALDEGARDIEAERLCAGDAELHSRVRHLLAALSRTDGFLEAPIGRTVRDAAQAQSQGGAQPGAPKIPGFSIESLIGVGGMAAVYEAMQELPRRRVALKVLRRSMAGAAALRRFEFETEVLARLRHPGIAQIYEAGTFDDGAGAIPFFAMEYIEGARTLTEYCAAEGLDMRARLELMIRVCDAVQHGHQHGVIHRDIKPGNVLVDLNGAPRVIDFGIARPVSSNAELRHTTMGQIIGTLNAMSPEQCTPNADVDARTDVYSLGVLLYELLCQRPPHNLASLPIPEALRVIHDVPPKRPSAIDSRLRGDIEAIVMKALEKEPDRRYRTVAALGTDIRRYLEHQAVEARPPTIFYQLRLFARRNRALVGAATIAALAMISATAISVVAAMRASEELQQRELAEKKVAAERDTAVRKTYVANVAAAMSSFQAGEYGQMVQQLNAAPVAYRGWEWRWLNAYADQSLASADAHGAPIVAIAASADGTTLMSASEDGTVRTWNLPSFTPRAMAKPGEVRLTDAVMLADGRRIVAVFENGDAAVVNAVDGTTIRQFDIADESIEDISAGANGSLAAVTESGKVFLWNADGPQPEQFSMPPVDDQAGTIDGLRYSSDGSALVTWVRSGLIHIRDPETFATRLAWSVDGSIGAVDVRADLDRMAIGMAEGKVVIRSMSAGAETVVLGMRDRVSLVRSVAFSADGAIIAVGQGNGIITSVDAATTALRGTLLGHRETVSALAFIQGDARLVSASWDGGIRLWDAQVVRDSPVHLVDGHEERVMAVEFVGPSAPGSRSRLLSASSDKTIRVRDVDEGEEIALMAGHTSDVFDACFSPDGALVASAGLDRTVRLWESASGKEVAVFKGHTNDVWTVAFSPDGRTLASAGTDQTIRLWDVATRTGVGTLEGHTARVISLAFSHDGTRLASASRDHTVRIWTLFSEVKPRVLTGHEWDVFAVAWSLDDKEVYSGSRDQTVRIWSAETGDMLAVLDDARRFVTSLALSPDGKRLVAGTWFGGICIFHPERREFVAYLKAVTGTVRSVAFSSDGRRLAVGAGDGGVRIFDCQSQATQGRLEGASRDGSPEGAEGH
jgi:eukaryotic-like serine/threonine-protein kinase